VGVQLAFAPKSWNKKVSDLTPDLKKLVEDELEFVGWAGEAAAWAAGKLDGTYKDMLDDVFGGPFGIQFTGGHGYMKFRYVVCADGKTVKRMGGLPNDSLQIKDEHGRERGFEFDHKDGIIEPGVTDEIWDTPKH